MKGGWEVDGRSCLGFGFLVARLVGGSALGFGRWALGLRRSGLGVRCDGPPLLALPARARSSRRAEGGEAFGVGRSEASVVGGGDLSR